MNQPNRFAPKARTIADMELDLSMFLVNCTAKALDATTLESLQRRYSRLNPRLVEAKLNAAVARRRGEPR
jgi:hypothetical protein